MKKHVTMASIDLRTNHMGIQGRDDTTVAKELQGFLP